MLLPLPPWSVSLPEPAYSSAVMKGGVERELTAQHAGSLAVDEAGDGGAERRVGSSVDPAGIVRGHEQRSRGDRLAEGQYGRAAVISWIVAGVAGGDRVRTGGQAGN